MTTPDALEPFDEFDSDVVLAHRYIDVQHESGPSFDEAPGTLENDVGPDLYRELLTAFVSHLSVHRVELSAALDEADTDLAKGVAHQLKGTASSFGASRLDELATRLLEIGADERGLLATLVSEIDTEICTFQAVVGV